MRLFKEIMLFSSQVKKWKALNADQVYSSFYTQSKEDFDSFMIDR